MMRICAGEEGKTGGESGLMRSEAGHENIKVGKYAHEDAAMDVWKDEERSNQKRTDFVRGSVKLVPVTKKMTEKRLKWNGQEKGHTMNNVRCTSTVEPL